MRFCQDHWDRLRKAIEDRGLGDLIARGGELAGAQIADQLRRGEEGESDVLTATNFDPLMSAHWGIATNIGNAIGPAFLYVMGSDEAPEDPVEGYGPKYDGRTWPRCPLCYINLAHEVSCKDHRCKLDKVNGYDWMIDRAADDAVEAAKKLGLRDGG